MTFAHLSSIFEPVNYTRKIIGFDAFGVFPEQESSMDNDFIRKFESDGGDGISKNELYECFTYKGIPHIELVKGDINHTVPEYAKNNQELRIAMLHIDVDVEKPTTVILETLYDKVVPGGIIVLDDYGTVYGETIAVDNFFSGMNVKLNKMPYSRTPAYIVKN